MTKRGFTLCILLVSFIFNSSFLDNAWVVFQKDNYKILFPSNPSADSGIIETKIGTVLFFTCVYESSENSNDSNLVYGLSVIDYPMNYISTDKVFLAGFFDGVIQSAASNEKGKLISEKDILLKNYPGKEIKIDYEEGTAIVTMKIILVNNRLFSLHTTSFPGKEINKNAAKFFNSFDIS